MRDSVPRRARPLASAVTRILRVLEWRIRHNEELISTTRHDDNRNDEKMIWRKEGSLIKTVINEDPIGKGPLGRPRLRWEDRVQKACQGDGTEYTVELSGRRQRKI